MPVVLLSILLSAAASLAAGQAFVRAAADANVNQRYLIENVSVGGVEVGRIETSKLPSSLRARLSALIGRRCDMAELEDLSAEIRRDLHLRTVNERLLKGSQPDLVQVDFDFTPGDVAFDVSVPKLLYTSQQQLSGEVDANIGFRRNSLRVGLVSNGDDLLERFTGLAARFDSAALGTDKLHASVTVEDYHETWNAATVAATEGSGFDLYSSRWSVSPQLTLVVASPLTVSAGTSFEEMEAAAPATGSRSANAATLDVHYGRKIEGDIVQQRIEGKYSLRVATRALGSTYAYARHLISFKYDASWGRHTASNEFVAGAIAGNAPLFDRFMLGNSSTLSGWNRFDIDPLGGSRVVHNEVTYGYRIGPGTVEAFYDTGTVWDPVQRAILRHSVGVGYRQGVFVLTTAFPIRDGRIEPVFIAGMNY